MTFEEVQKFGLIVSRETFHLLEQYATLLQEWNQRLNLISRDSEKDLWHRHILDSLQVQQLILNKDAYIADLGSGAGLPGVVLALAGYTQVTLIEKDAKKATFLRYVSRETNIPFVVLEQDISHVTTVYDVVVARGLAPLSDLLAYALPLMKPDGHGLFLKGETVDAEIMMAQCHYGEMTFLKKRSITHPKASLVWVSKTNDGQEGASDFNRDCQSKRRRGKNHDSC